MMFKLRVHECNGQAYEDLFVSVMGKRYPQFKPVKPHGNVGDRKNVSGKAESPLTGRWGRRVEGIAGRLRLSQAASLTCC